MSIFKNTLLISALSVSLHSAASANTQRHTVERGTGPNVTIEGLAQASHLALDASRSFEMVQGSVDLESARSLSGRLMARAKGLAAAPLLELSPSTDGRRFEYTGAQDPSAFVRINGNTGDISFNRGMRGFEVQGNTPNLPHGEDATRLALEHLERLGLMPAKRDELVVRHIGGLRMSERNEDGSTSDFDKLTTVHFGRTLDGLAVGGPGSKIIVHLGANGELVGMQRRWIELRATDNAEASFLSTGEARETIESHLREEWRAARSVRSETPTAGFYDDGQGRIEPALFFRAKLDYDEALHEFARDDYTRDYLGVISALRVPRAMFAQRAAAALAPSDAQEQTELLPGGDNE